MDLTDLLARLFFLFLLFFILTRTSVKKQSTQTTRTQKKKVPSRDLGPANLPKKPIKEKKIEEPVKEKIEEPVKQAKENILIEVIEPIKHSIALREELKKLSRKKFILAHTIIGQPKGLQKKGLLPLNDLPGESH